MNVEQLKAKILNYVAKHEHTSFAELDQIEGFSGGVWACFMGGENNLLWWRMSDIGIAAWTELQDERLVRLHPCDVFIYLVDNGAIPPFPVARRAPPASGFKKVHWFPSTITLR